MSLFSFLFSYYYNNVLKQAYSFLSFVTIIFSGQAKNAMFGTSHDAFPREMHRTSGPAFFAGLS